MSVITGLFAALCYLVTWALIAYKVKNDYIASFKQSWIIAVWALAVLLHAASLYYPLYEEDNLRIDFFSATSHIALLSSLILLLTISTRRIHVLSLFVLPIILISLLVPLMGLTTERFIHISGPLALHIMLSMLGYSTLFLATLQALLLMVQNQQLHNHQPGGIIRQLPALEDMENLLFRLILAGVILLTAGLLTGFIFLEDLFGKQVMHKTVLSIIAWLIYTTLLVGHWRQGWRGRKAVNWTLSAFVVLILAFLGSKFVHEFLLG